MITLRAKDITTGLKDVSNLVKAGEKIIIARPHNQNLVIISESEYNQYEKARRDLEAINLEKLKA